MQTFSDIETAEILLELETLRNENFKLKEENEQLKGSQKQYQSYIVQLAELNMALEDAEIRLRNYTQHSNSEKEALANANVSMAELFGDLQDAQSELLNSHAELQKMNEEMQSTLHALSDANVQVATLYEELENKKESLESLLVQRETEQKKLAEANIYMVELYEELEDSKNKLEEANEELKQLNEELNANIHSLSDANVCIAELYENLSDTNGRLEEANEELQQLNEEINTTLELVQMQNKEIASCNKKMTSSILYASRIQQSVLPKEEFYKHFSEDHFIFFQPKDIVSGDFYWLADKGDSLIIVVGDCTGHGVPGAFMSLVGMELLNRIVHDKEEHDPSKILQKLQDGLQSTLRTQLTGTPEGMDVSVLALRRVHPSVNVFNKITFAGAMQSLFVLYKDRLDVYKGDRTPIGGIHSQHWCSMYTNQVVPLEHGMKIFMASDGFQDQFGGEENRKFLVSRVRELFSQQAEKSMEEVHYSINEAFTTWKGDYKQTDDVTLIGLTPNLEI